MTRASKKEVHFLFPERLDLAPVLARLDAHDRAIAELQAENAALKAELGRRRGPRDRQDNALLQALAATIGGRLFTASELLAHARATDPELQAALTAADISTPVELGLLLGRLVDRVLDGRVVRRARVARGRARWRVEVVEESSAPEDARRLRP